MRIYHPTSLHSGDMVGVRKARLLAVSEGVAEREGLLRRQHEASAMMSISA
jgi:hypothetical protein